MKRSACVLIREQPYYRRDSFLAGLRSVGYDIVPTPRPHPDGVVVIWNRYGGYESVAKQYEKAGGTVLIAENGYLGRDWLGAHWYAIARNFHNGAGWWPTEPEYTPLSKQRWNTFGVDLQPWRRDGKEIVVLATRSIGPQGVCEPRGWSDQIAKRISARHEVRIRTHPGENKCVPLEKDLENARAVVTWGSGGALKALLWGIPVFHGFPKWIGASAAKMIDGTTDFDFPSMPNRISMFRQLAHAMWTTTEIESGEPFRCLLA